MPINRQVAAMRHLEGGALSYKQVAAMRQA